MTSEKCGLRAAERLKCILMNLGSEIRVFQDLLTHLIFIRGLTGSQDRISVITSSGKNTDGGGLALRRRCGDFRGWVVIRVALLIRMKPNVMPD